MGYSCLHEGPIFVRELLENERERLEASLRSKDAFVMRRCQILLASARGESPPEDSRKPRVRLPNGEECHPSLQREGPRRPRRRLLAPQARPCRLRWQER
jgi:hypothetical protein